MATPPKVTSSQFAGDLIRSDRKITKPGGDCPVPNCSITVSVYETGANAPPLPIVTAEVVTVAGPKPTGKDGIQTFKNLTDPDKNFTVKVTLDEPDRKIYVWVSGNEAAVSDTKYVGASTDQPYTFELVRLAWPKIKVTWEDDKPAGGVGVKLTGKNALSGEVPFPNVDAATGLSPWAEDKKGLRPDTYDVSLDFGADAENIEMLKPSGTQPPFPIDVPSGCKDTFPFQARKCWVEFVVTDQFDNPVEKVGYLLTYPDGKKKVPGEIAAGKKGSTEQKPAPPGQYTLALKMVFDARWDGDADLVVGTAQKLTAQVTGFDAGTDVTFEIYDACVRTGAALDSVTVQSGDKPATEANWTPAAAKLDKVTSGSVVFVAKAGAMQAMSPPRPIRDKRIFNVNAQAGPLETKLVLHLVSADMKEEKMDAQSNAQGEASPLVLLGRRVVAIELPDLTAWYATIKGPADAKALQFLTPKQN